MKAKALLAAFALMPLWVCAPTEILADDILENAKKEGQVVFYASMELPVSQRLASLFEQKYPFLKVVVTRIGSEIMATRLVTEAQAKQVKGDVVHQSGFDFTARCKKGSLKATLRLSAPPFPPISKTTKDIGSSTR